MAFYEELVAATEEARAAFLSIPRLVSGAKGEISQQSYIAYLTEAYHHVKHTTPFLMACGGRLPERLEWLRTAIVSYLEEEVGHQEWILNDLKACGVDPETVRRGQPLPATELMVAYVYDTIHRLNPVGFFGTVLVLEGTSVQLAVNAAGTIQQRLQLPDKAFSYLNSHGTLDISHMQTFESLMNRLEDEGDKQAVIHCARTFYKLFGNLFRSLPMDETEGKR